MAIRGTFILTFSFFKKSYLLIEITFDYIVYRYYTALHNFISLLPIFKTEARRNVVLFPTFKQRFYGVFLQIFPVLSQRDSEYKWKDKSNYCHEGFFCFNVFHNLHHPKQPPFTLICRDNKWKPSSFCPWLEWKLQFSHPLAFKWPDDINSDRGKHSNWRELMDYYYSNLLRHRLTVINWNWMNQCVS